VTKDDIQHARWTAQRFLAACEVALRLPDIAIEITGCRATGDLRRCSLDLTRSLADMRGRNKPKFQEEVQ
jgi:hypothetical protein